MKTKFKQTEIGLIPEEWDLVEFLDLLSEKSRNGIYKQKQFHGDGIKIINMKELFAYSRIGNQNMKRVRLNDSEMSRFLVREGDLLFARRSLVAEGSGKCSLIVEHSEPITFESSIILARPNVKIADSKFLYYYFLSPKGRQVMATILRQVAVSGITGSDLMKLKIIKPIILEQKSIAKILSDIDSKIELNEKMNITLETIGKAIFKHWFIDFEFPNQEGKPYKFADGEMIDSELGRIPNGWQIVILDRIKSSKPNSIATGPFGSSMKTNDYVESGIPVIRGKNIKTGMLNENEFVYVTENKANQLKSSNAFSGDILIVSQGNIGQVGIIPENSNYHRYILSSNLMKITCDPNIVNNFYVYYYLGSNLGQEYLLGNTSTTGVPHIAQPSVTLKRTPIILPSKNILDLFGNIIDSIFTKISNTNSEIQTLSQLRDSLLPKLMSGKIRVPVEAK